VEFVATMRVIDPYRWLFASPADVNNQVLKRLDSVLRAWVRSGDQNHAQSARGNGKKLWEEITTLDCLPVFEEVQRKMGSENRGREYYC